MNKYWGVLLFFVFIIHEGFSQQPILTILHTNDTHSQIEPFDINNDKNVGGVVCRDEVIERERKSDVPVLLLDAGDFSKGSFYSIFFKGEVEIELMNRMKYDVVGLGNHEFDDGTAVLVQRLKKAKFEVICANYHFANKQLAKIVKPYTIIKRGGLKIGLFGLTIQLNGLVNPNMIKDVQYLDPVTTSQKMVSLLKKKKKCDLVICLSHLGISPDDPDNPVITDSILAASVNGIDIIIGGHNHHLLEQPIIINNTKILQLDYGGIRIGKLSIYKKNDNE